MKMTEALANLEKLIIQEDKFEYTAALETVRATIEGYENVEKIKVSKIQFIFK